MTRKQILASQRFPVLIGVIFIAGLGFTRIDISSLVPTSQQDLQGVGIHHNVSSWAKFTEEAKSESALKEYNDVAKTPTEHHALPYKCGEN